MPKKSGAKGSKGSKGSKKTATTTTEDRAADEVGDPIALLLADVDAFNAWRQQHLDVDIDLRERDLRGTNLRRAFLAGARFDGAQLDDAALAGALLSGASFVGASLRRADLRGACFGRGELIHATLAMSPLGSALMRGADLRDAKLDAARVDEAVFLEADLSGASLDECNLADADLRHARLDGPLPDSPPSADDSDALLASLGEQALEVREGLARFALMVFLAGDRNADANGLLHTLAEALHFDPPTMQALLPRDRIVLEQLPLAAPDSHWLRRVYFALMCGLASTTSPVAGMQLQVLGHFGEQLGMSNPAMARIIGEELGISIGVS